jgi:hypothetical protein
MKITLDLPEIEGYELAEGKQPRIPKKGECICAMDGVVMDTYVDTMVDKFIILKKKGPKYAVIDGAAFEKKYVEIKALEDALELSSGIMMNGYDIAIYKELYSLLN